jgi:hypothetical protein
MKNINVPFLVVVLSLVCLSGCKKDGPGDDDPCESVMCHNGDCIDGSCQCDPGWAGTACDYSILQGEYAVSEVQYPGGATVSYTVSIYLYEAYPANFNISNLGDDLESITIEPDSLNPTTNLVVPYQDYTFMHYIQGSGTINTTSTPITMTITYRVTPSIIGNRVATLTKL